MRKIAFVILSLCFTLTASIAQDIFVLALTGSPLQMQAAIAAGAQVNSIEKTDLGGISPLMYSLRNKDPQVLAVLIREGADAGFLQMRGDLVWATPLIQAAANEKPEYVRLLLAAGADVNQADSVGLLPVLSAASNPNAKVMESILEARPGLGDLRDIHGGLMSALCIAVGENPNPAVAELLLKAGDDPNAFNGKHAPLGFAAVRDRPIAFYSLLIAAGADVTAAEPLAEGVEGQTPLELAAEFSTRPEAITAIVAAGAEVNRKRLPTATTSLMTAARRNDSVPVLLALIKAGALVDEVDYLGMSALMIAAQSSASPKIVDALLKAGADPAPRSVEGLSALDYAKKNAAMREPSILAALEVRGSANLFELAMTGTAEAMRKALAEGSRPRGHNPNGESPLTIAVQHNRDIGVAAALLAAGAPVDDRNGLDRTPLMLAAEANPDPAFIKFLLKAGADPRARTHDMFAFTALMLAAQANPEPEILSALLTGGCELEAIDNLGRSALIIAAGNSQNPKVLGALLNAGANARLVDLTMQTALDWARKNPAMAQSHQLAALAAASK